MGRFGLGAVGARPLDERKGTLNRRQLLKIGTVVAGSALVPGAALAALRVPYPPERSLKIYNLHTGETLTAQYCENGCYVEGALQRNQLHYARFQGQ